MVDLNCGHFEGAMPRSFLLEMGQSSLHSKLQPNIPPKGSALPGSATSGYFGRTSGLFSVVFCTYITTFHGINS